MYVIHSAHFETYSFLSVALEKKTSSFYQDEEVVTPLLKIETKLHQWLEHQISLLNINNDKNHRMKGLL